MSNPLYFDHNAPRADRWLTAGRQFGGVVHILWQRLSFREMSDQLELITKVLHPSEVHDQVIYLSPR